MSFFIMYLLMVLSSFQAWLGGVTFILGVALVLTIVARFFIYLDYKSGSDFKVFNNIVKWLIGLVLALSLIGHLIPSKRDMAIIAAGGITYNAVTSDKAKEIGNRGSELLLKKLDQMLEDPVEAVKDAKKVVDEVQK